MAGHINSQGRVDWNTPENLLVPIREFFGGSIDLDPCSNSGSIVGAKVNYVLPVNDGLRDPWAQNGVSTCFVNPPFGSYFMHRLTKEIVVPKDMREMLKPLSGPEQAVVKAQYERHTIREWIQRGANEADSGLESIYLIPAQPGTRAWQGTIFPHASAICWLRGRPKFRGAAAGSPMDCALVYFCPTTTYKWQHRTDFFVEHFRPLGATQAIRK